MAVSMTARIWNESGEEEYTIEADNVGNVINLSQGDQSISIMDGEQAQSMIEAIAAYAALLGWEVA